MYIPLTFEGALSKCLFASGGLEGFFISGSEQYKYHLFTGSANLVVQKGTIDNVQIYVIGGGGGGARGTANVSQAGGGGGGGTNFTMNARLYQGTYNIQVGKGGDIQSTQNTAGFNGVTSSFKGANINMIAGAGGGAPDAGGGISGNGFAGGTGGFDNGGGGGGSTGVGDDSTAIKAGNGGAGNTFFIAGIGIGYGCGGGGYARFTADEPGFSCNDAAFGAGGEGNNSPNDGANRYGMGGGGGGDIGAAGGSGSVIIQYTIFDYCTNYFNETGSCGCRQITFGIDDQNYTPDRTGSYIYMPCGESKFASGSLSAYAPLTVCAVSNSYFTFTPNVNTPLPLLPTASFAITGPECFSASLVSIPCSPEAFPATSQSIIVTNYTPSGSGGNPNTFRFVAKNATTHSIYTSTSARVNYVCISTGSLFEGLDRYPKVLTGPSNILFNTASCNNVTFQSTATFPNNRFYRYYDCNGVSVAGSFNGPGSLNVCIDRSAPFGFTGNSGSTSVTIGTECLGLHFDTGSC